MTTTTPVTTKLALGKKKTIKVKKTNKVSALNRIMSMIKSSNGDYNTFQRVTSPKMLAEKQRKREEARAVAGGDGDGGGEEEDEMVVEEVRSAIDFLPGIKLTLDVKTTRGASAKVFVETVIKRDVAFGGGEPTTTVNLHVIPLGVTKYEKSSGGVTLKDANDAIVIQNSGYIDWKLLTKALPEEPMKFTKSGEVVLTRGGKDPVLQAETLQQQQLPVQRNPSELTEDEHKLYKNMQIIQKKIRSIFEELKKKNKSVRNAAGSFVGEYGNVPDCLTKATMSDYVREKFLPDCVIGKALLYPGADKAKEKDPSATNATAVGDSNAAGAAPNTPQVGDNGTETGSNEKAAAAAGNTSNNALYPMNSRGYYTLPTDDLELARLVTEAFKYKAAVDLFVYMWHFCATLDKKLLHYPLKEHIFISLSPKKETPSPLPPVAIKQRSIIELRGLSVSNAISARSLRFDKTTGRIVEIDESKMYNSLSASSAANLSGYGMQYPPMAYANYLAATGKYAVVLPIEEIARRQNIDPLAKRDKKIQSDAKKNKVSLRADADIACTFRFVPYESLLHPMIYSEPCGSAVAIREEDSKNTWNSKDKGDGSLPKIIFHGGISGYTWDQPLIMRELPNGRGAKEVSSLYFIEYNDEEGDEALVGEDEERTQFLRNLITSKADVSSEDEDIQELIYAYKSKRRYRVYFNRLKKVGGEIDIFSKTLECFGIGKHDVLKWETVGRMFVNDASGYARGSVQYFASEELALKYQSSESKVKLTPYEQSFFETRLMIDQSTGEQYLSVDETILHDAINIMILYKSSHDIVYKFIANELFFSYGDIINESSLRLDPSTAKALIKRIETASVGVGGNIGDAGVPDGSSGGGGAGASAASASGNTGASGGSGSEISGAVYDNVRVLSAANQIVDNDKTIEYRLITPQYNSLLKRLTKESVKFGLEGLMSNSSSASASKSSSSSSKSKSGSAAATTIFTSTDCIEHLKKFGFETSECDDIFTFFKNSLEKHNLINSFIVALPTNYKDVEQKTSKSFLEGMGVSTCEGDEYEEVEVEDVEEDEEQVVELGKETSTNAITTTATVTTSNTNDSMIVENNSDNSSEHTDTSDSTTNKRKRKREIDPSESVANEDEEMERKLVESPVATESTSVATKNKGNKRRKTKESAPPPVDEDSQV